MIDLQKEGKIRHLALSNVSVREVEQALEKAPVVSVQNMFNVAGGGGQLAKMSHAEVEAPEAVLALCEAKGIAFMPFFPLAVGGVEKVRPGLAEVAKRHGATTAQVAISWLLARSPVMLPIPGTGSVAHLEENWAAREIALSASEVEEIARG
jgi:aryl-alcohol dehydrogenase-like predicted oxidoreductase